MFSAVYTILLLCYYLFTKIHKNSPRHTVSYCSPGFPGPPRGSLGPPGVRSQKVPRVILSIQSVLPSKGNRESLRKSEKVEKVRKSSRTFEKD